MQKRLATAIEAIRQNPVCGNHIKPLTNNAQDYRYSLSNLRIIYTVNHQEKLVEISSIGPRGDIYKIGKPPQQALREMADRLAVNDFSSFIGSIILADQLGISIGNVLRLQSKEMRQKRRQRAEEKAMKAPIKMLIPMVLFIFPAIFIVLLGPAAIQLSRAFNF
ncbi:MAG: type II secretion system F family protein [Desulfotomaculum sp.]|nr:type II secretion system F family protein [Desulfotomaculum sp.]